MAMLHLHASHLLTCTDTHGSARHFMRAALRGLEHAILLYNLPDALKLRCLSISRSSVRSTHSDVTVLHCV